MPARRTVIALTVVALVLRVATLDVQSYWSDEAATVLVLRHSFRGMLDAVWDGESTPPLFYILDWLWSKLAGTGGVALRLPSALFGAAAVPVVAALARRVVASAGDARTRDRAAVFAAALAAVSPLTVWYGQEARAYALLMLLAAGSTLALLRMLEVPSRGRLALWAGLAVAACWAHHFALFLVVGQGLWALWVLRGRAVWAVGAVGAGAVALAPLLLHQRDAGRATFIADVPLGTRLAQVPKQVLVGYDGPAELPLTLLGVAAVLVATAGLWRLVVGGGEGPGGRGKGRGSGLGRERERERGEGVHSVSPGRQEKDALAEGERERGKGVRSVSPGRQEKDALAEVRRERGKGVRSVSPGRQEKDALSDGGRGGAVGATPTAAVVVVSIAGLGFALPCLAALVGQDFLLTRNLLGVLPLGLALLGAGAAGAADRRAGFAAMGALTATGLLCAVAVALSPGYQRDDYRAAVRAALGTPAAPRLVVTDAAGRLPASLYLGTGTTVVVPGQLQRVREIDVVRTAGAEPGRGRSTPVLPDGVAPAGFVLVSDRHGETWRTRRFVAPITVAVDPGALGILAPGRPLIVLARPR